MESILQKINKASLKFLSPLSLKETYRAICDEAKKLVGAEESSIFLLRDGKLERIYATSQSLFKINIKKTGYVYKTFKTKSPRLLNVEEIKDIHKEIIKAKIKSIIHIPLSYRDKTMGVLTVYSLDKKLFTNEQFDALKIFGSLASMAIRKSNLYADMEKTLKERNTYMNLESVLEKIHNSSMKYLEPLSPHRVYPLIVKEAIKLVNADHGSLLLEEKKVFKRVFTTLPFNIGIRKKGNSYKAFKSKKAFYIHHLKSIKHKKAYPLISKEGIKSIIYIPLLDKKESIGVLVLHSKKERYFSRKELKMLILYGSLASLAIRKSQLHEQTKKAVEVRDLFISLAAHELKTPLTTLNGYIQILNSKTKDQSRESKWIRNIYRESQRLTGLIQDLLEINRIKSGKFQFFLKECNLEDVVKQAIDNLRFNYPTRKTIFRANVLDLENKIVGDYDKLVQVFTNILENSAKFSKEDTLINVNLKQKDNYLLVEVEDKGKGIPKRDINKIFDGFYKGKNSNEESGMGLGLFLGKSIIEELHGKIKVDSKLNEGTTVRIFLPLVNYNYEGR